MNLWKWVREEFDSNFHLLGFKTKVESLYISPKATTV